MKNIYLKHVILFVAVFFGSFSWAQTVNGPTSPLSPIEQCVFDSKHQEKMMTDPVYYQNTINFNNLLLNSAPTKVGNTTLRVPVVVHVMEEGTSLTQISDEQIRQGILSLNERFRKIPGSLGDGNGVDVELEFVLAVRDPSGNCTNGIVRYDLSGNATYVASGVYSDVAGVTDTYLKAQSFWNSSNYYNIWLVSEIDNNNGGFGIQGYAFFASAHGTSYDGAVILTSNWKNANSTTGTHEIGHAFNLYHTFEGDNNGSSCPTNSNCTLNGDRVCDTPPHIRSSSNCVVAPNACDGGSSSNLHIHNYMDYSSDACQSEFTAGQKVRVAAAMNGPRSSFLAANGNMSLVPPSPPVVDFHASADFFCLGSAIQFTDISGCVPNTFLDSTYWTGITFNWTFTNGVDTYTSTLQNPLMNFPNPGVYDVTLAITTGSGSDTHSEIGFFTIGATATAACIPGSSNSGNFGQSVSKVEFNTLNNSTPSIQNIAYTDFTCTANTIVTAGSTYPINVDINAGGSGPEVLEVYIDYNNNGTFEVTELVHSGTTASAGASVTSTGSITIPGTAVQNTLLRMRVIGETNSISANERNCLSDYFIGEVEDYGVYVKADCTPPVIATGTVSNPTTCAGTNGTIVVTGSGTGIVSWTGTASGNSGSVTLPYDITGLAAGTYSITYSETVGCNSNTLSQTLTDPGGTTIAAGTIANPTTCAATDGTIQITGSGTGTVNWSGAATGTSGSITLPYTITGLAAGTYSITFSASGCTSNTVSQTLSDPSSATIATGTVSNPATCAATNGSIQITGTGTGTVNWSGTASGTSGSVTLPYTISGLAAGTYSISFTATGCTSNTLSQTLSDPATATIASGTISNPTNCGGMNGTIQITGTGTGTVNWTGTAAGTSGSVTLPYTITGLGAGTYSISFTSTGCTSNTLSETLTEPGVTTIAAGTIVNPATCGGTDGTIEITGSGLGDLNWTGSSSGTVSSVTFPYTITGLGAGTYSISLFSFGCTSNTLSQTLTDPAPTTIAVGTTGNPTTCAGTDGTIQITGSGTGTVNWTGTAVGTSGSVTLPYVISGLAAGSYTVDFAPTTGCGANTVSQSLADPTTPTIATGTTANPSTCAGTNGSIQITGSGTGTVNWYGTATGTSGSITLPYTITGLAAGAYSISFSSTGCASNTLSQTLTDPATPALPVVTASGATTFCAGNSVDLTSSYATGNVWSSTATTQAITVSTAGSFTVTHTDVNGCSSTSTPITVTVNALPTAPTITASAATTFCDGGSVDLTSSVASGNTWSTSATTQTITATTSGSYDVMITDGNGCSATSAATVVTVNALPATPVITASGATTFCEGGSVDLTSSVSSGITWTTSEITQTITVVVTGSYDVMISDGNGCTATSAATIVTVNALPPTPTITASGSTTLCAGQSVDLTSSEATGNVWSTTDATQTITVSATGNYDVTFTDGNGCSAISAPITVSGGNQPTVSGGSNTTICEGEMTTLIGSGAQSYAWDNGITDNVPFTPAVGTITYTVTGTDANGCTNTATVDVTVSPIPVVTLTTDAVTCVQYAPSTLIGTPAGGTFLGPNVIGNQFDPASAGVGTHTVYYEFTSPEGCVGETTTTIFVEACASINDLTQVEVKVYPNPMESSLNIELEGDFAITLYDSRGRLVHQESGSDLLTISTADYEAGIYLVQVRSEQINSTIRVVKN